MMKMRVNFTVTDDAKAALEAGATFDMVLVGKIKIEDGEPTMIFNEYTIHADRGHLYATAEPAKA